MTTCAYGQWGMAERCENKATSTLHHPVLGPLPLCDHHRAVMETNLGTQR